MKRRSLAFIVVLSLLVGIPLSATASFLCLPVSGASSRMAAVDTAHDCCPSSPNDASAHMRMATSACCHLDSQDWPDEPTPTAVPAIAIACAPRAPILRIPHTSQTLSIPVPLKQAAPRAPALRRSAPRAPPFFS